MSMKQNKTTCSVLFVDDDQNLLQAISRALRGQPYQVMSCESGEKALDLMHTKSVDVIVSDQHMPKMQGTELLKEVCRRYPTTVRMMLTGKAQFEVAMNAINVGEIYRFFLKPFNIVELGIALQNAIEYRGLLLHSRRLLTIAKAQSQQLQELESQYPGITNVRRDSSGYIVSDEPLDSLEKALREFEHQSLRLETKSNNGGPDER